MKLKHVKASLVCMLATAVVANAAVITQWNFNSLVSDANTATGVTTPAIGAGTASLIGGTTATFASGDASGGSTDTATGDDSGWNVTSFPAASTASGTAGVQFLVSTAGYQGITVTWDQRHSNSAARHVQLQYTINGTDWSNFTASGSGTDGGLYIGTTGDTWFNNRTADLTGLTTVNDNNSFGLRIVTVFDPANNTSYVGSGGAYATSGTMRFDMVTVSGTAIPEPSTYAVIATALIMGVAIWRRRK